MAAKVKYLALFPVELLYVESNLTKSAQNLGESFFMKLSCYALTQLCPAAHTFTIFRIWSVLIPRPGQCKLLAHALVSSCFNYCMQCTFAGDCKQGPHETGESPGLDWPMLWQIHHQVLQCSTAVFFATSHIQKRPTFFWWPIKHWMKSDLFMCWPG